MLLLVWQGRRRFVAAAGHQILSGLEVVKSEVEEGVLVLRVAKSGVEEGAGFDLQQELEWSVMQFLGIPRPTLEPKRASLAIDIDSFRLV